MIVTTIVMMIVAFNILTNRDAGDAGGVPGLRGRDGQRKEAED